MLTGALKSHIDRICDAFWSCGISKQGPEGLFPSSDVDTLIAILDHIRETALAV
jgi:hypothetical protein